MSAPTDMELMLFHDGELEEPRRAEVAAWLEQSDAGRIKVSGLALGSELVRDVASSRAASFDVAGAVMAALARGENGQAHDLDAATRGGGKVIDIKARKTAPAAEEGKDGGRLLLPLTALAAAAAAALFFWGRTDPAPKTTEVAKTDATETALSVQPMPPAPPSMEPPLFGHAEPDEPDPSVTVAVNFGSRQGSVFYVGGATQDATTTVVWVTEE